MLCNGILRDPALTQQADQARQQPRLRALRRHRQHRSARAVAILGYDGVRGAALSLMLLEHLGNKAQRPALRGRSWLAYFSGIVAREVAAVVAGVRNVEEAAVCAMFHGLGRMLAVFYLPEEAAEVRLRVEARGAGRIRRLRAEVLGVTYAELGIAVARY